MAKKNKIMMLFIVVACAGLIRSAGERAEATDFTVLDQQPAYEAEPASRIVHLPVSSPEGEVPEELLLELKSANENGPDI